MDGPASSVTAAQRANRRDMRARQIAREKVKSPTRIPRGHDIHHNDGNPRNNARANLAIMPRSANRVLNKH